MSDVFVICNQLGQYWGKKKKWVDGTDPKKIMLCKHEDEGVNLLVELGARDYELRGEVRQVETNERGVPVVVPSEHLIEEEPEVLLEVEAEPEIEVAENPGAEPGPDALVATAAENKLETGREP